MKYCIMSAPAVKWLMGTEPAIQGFLEKWMRGEAPPCMNVHGLPLEGEMTKARDNRDYMPEIPEVSLHFDAKSDPMAGMLVATVTCSDEDLREIERWQRAASLKAA